ncbi:Structural maintenance of chromosomes protein 4 [Cichlidogyrus casuarinus]|uniref:Structural maintenance of chromosomes protein 4 n=1 Tax=Cichlidogyrus casuarinus TaxID=1844966 RepID=A0ABD2Q9X4_9PLAT
MDKEVNIEHDINKLLELGVEEFIDSCKVFPEPPAPSFDTKDRSVERLMIHKIVIENFKSYGARKTLGPFHKNLSCIIGPNGSGKSNVIDSMLFVFGFRSTKIRSKKVGNLVHKSLLLPNIEYCQVEVHFQKIIDTGDGPEDYNVVPDTSFTISRRVHADGTGSCYYIDSTRATIKDVTKILSNNGVDLEHNRFLILQGEVEQIALMKPKAPSEHEDGFLEYLEDIIGSGRFKYPLAILAARIERLKDIKLEKVARLKVVEKEKRELEGIRNEAIQYLKRSNAVIALKNKLWQINEYKESKREAQLFSQLEKIVVNLNESKAKIRELNLDVNEKKLQLEKLNKEKEQIDAVAVEMKEELNGFNAEDAKIQDDVSHLRTTGKAKKKQLAAEEKKINEISDFPETAKQRKKELLAKIATLEENKKIQDDNLQEVMQNLEKETKPLRTKIEKMEAEVLPLQTEADEALSRFNIAKQELDLLLSARNREIRRAEQAKSQLDKVNSDLEQLDQRLASASDHKSLNAKVGRTEKDLKQLVDQETKIKQEVNQLRAKYAQLRSDTHSEEKSTNRVLNALLQACNTGELRGIVGRLGDLGAVPKKYDVAISTCCGPLDNIVTESIDDAQSAVNYLKRHNLGHATFIGLDKMQRFQSACDAPFTPPDVETPRVFDLVEPVDPRYRSAFYYALRDTLVAPTLEKARAIAFQGRQRFRVVSLKGELVEVSGAMSGGGTRCLSGRMCTDLSQAKQRASKGRNYQDRRSETEDEEVKLAKLTQELNRREQELNALMENRSKLEETLTMFKRQMRDAEANVRECQNERPRLVRAIERFQKEIADAEARAKQTGPSQADQKKAQNDLDKLAQESEKKSQKASKSLDDLNVRKQELIKIGDERLELARTRVKAVTVKIKETKTILNKLEVDLASSERNEARSKEKIVTLKLEVEEIKKRFEELLAVQSELETKSAEKLKEFESTKKKAGELDSKRNKLNDEFEEINERLNSEKQTESRIRIEKDDLDRETEECKNRMKAWIAKIRSLRLYKLDDEDDTSVLDEELIQKSFELPELQSEAKPPDSPEDSKAEVSKIEDPADSSQNVSKHSVIPLSLSLSFIL